MLNQLTKAQNERKAILNIPISFDEDGKKGKLD